MALVGGPDIHLESFREVNGNTFGSRISNWIRFEGAVGTLLALVRARISSWIRLEGALGTYLIVGYTIGFVSRDPSDTQLASPQDGTVTNYFRPGRL